MRAFFPLLTLLSWVTTSWADSSGTCYYPDGTITTAYKPCSSGGQSNCCEDNANEKDVCLSNNLCIDGNVNQVFRGACTGTTPKRSK
jgi:hypothetical protein